jgi:D-alanine-D-alanine ligase
VVKTASEIQPALELASRYDDEVMIESFIAGRELTVGILGDEALPVGEIIPKHEIYDYECKYQAGMAVEEFPAKITATQTSSVQELARRAFRSLKLRGYARFDFRMRLEKGKAAFNVSGDAAGDDANIRSVGRGCGNHVPELCERIVRVAPDAREWEDRLTARRRTDRCSAGCQDCKPGGWSGRRQIFVPSPPKPKRRRCTPGFNLRTSSAEA